MNDSFAHRLPHQTTQVARGVTAALLLLVGGAVAVASSSGARPVVVASTLGAVGAVAWITAPARWRDPRWVAAGPAIRAALTVVVTIGMVVVLTSGMGLLPRPGALLFGVVMVQAAYVLQHPVRQVLLAGVAVAWVATLAAAGERDVVVLATHASGATLLAVVASRTAAVAEGALAGESAAAREARARTTVLLAVLRLQSLDPVAVVRALEEAVGRLGGEATLWRPLEPAPDDAAVASVATEVVATGATVHRHDGRRGARRSLLGSPLRVDGEVLAVLVVVTPGRLGTERRDALGLLSDEAARAMRRADAFAQDAATADELRRLEAVARDVVSTVSHELRTPVTVVAGLSQTLSRRWDDLPAPKREDLLSRIDANAERLAAMVRSLLDTSELERGELRLVREPVPLRSLVVDVTRQLASVLSPRTVHLDVPDDLSVDADGPLLRNVVENLLGNVARHTPADTTVHVTARAEGGDVAVVVADDGPGIATEDVPHVLERFYRAPDPDRAPGGLGLGLALCRQIVLAHGRDLQVDSAPGGGARFSFALPAASPPAPAPRDPPPPDGTSSSDA